jgi:hypothetical protein
MVVQVHILQDSMLGCTSLPAQNIVLQGPLRGTGCTEYRISYMKESVIEIDDIILADLREHQLKTMYTDCFSF